MKAFADNKKTVVDKIKEPLAKREQDFWIELARIKREEGRRGK